MHYNKIYKQQRQEDNSKSFQRGRAVSLNEHGQYLRVTTDARRQYGKEKSAKTRIFTIQEKYCVNLKVSQKYSQKHSIYKAFPPE